MCTPIALGIATLVTTAAATGVQAYGQYKQGKAANEAAEYNAKIQEENAAYAEEQARSSEEAGKKEEKAFRANLSRFKGKQRSSFAASGVLLDEGSPLEALTETAEFGEMDALSLRHNNAMRTYGIQHQSQDYLRRANLSRMSKSSAWLGAGSSLLTGASRMGGQYMSARGSGIF